MPYVGEGTAIFNSLHVGAITPFLLKLLNLALQEQGPQGSVYERCYLIGGRETGYKKVAEAFAKLFYWEGVISTPQAKSVSLEEAGKGELPMLMANEMRFVSNRAKALGYKHEEPDLIKYLSTQTRY